MAILFSLLLKKNEELCIESIIKRTNPIDFLENNGVSVTTQTCEIKASNVTHS